jgi:hypothetical protein
MKPDKSRLRQALRRTEASRATAVKKILREAGTLRRGAFVTVRRKCGKPNCHCASGEGHPAQYLSVKESGKTRMVFVPAPLAKTVAEQAGRYRRFRQARATLAKLSQESLRLIDELERALETAEAIPRRPKKKRPARGPKPSRKKKGGRSR